MKKSVLSLMMGVLLIVPTLSWAERAGGAGKAFHQQQKVKREEHWLKNEAPAIARKFIKPLALDFQSSRELDEQHLKYYPVHSITAWLKELPVR